MIQLYRVTKEYPPHSVGLHDVTLRIKKGEFVFLTGPSGAGKTTLLKLLFRAELPTQGQIIVNGQNVGAMKLKQVPHFRRNLGIVFQDFRLLPRKTVFENVSFVLNILGVPYQERKERAFKALKQVGLHLRMHNFPQELSAGEQQRVSLARALINDPVVLLADEPTGNLDPALAREIMELFTEINARGTTLLIATHALALVQTMKKRVIHIKDGRVAQDSVV